MPTGVIAPTSAIGYISGADGFNGLLADFLEDVPALRWPDSVAVYEKMRRDPQITAVLAALTLPVRRATWAVDPNGAADRVTMAVAEDVGLPILGAQDDPPPTRRRGVKWPTHLRLALLKLVFGHMPFERRYDIRDGQARLVALSERMPATIASIEVNRDGSLKQIEQYPLTVEKATPIPAARLAWYANDQEGAHWQGRSLLRSAYGPWLFKHEMQRVLATSSRRFGMGIPTVTAPPGATPAQIMEAQRLASAARGGEQGGAGLPSGFTYALQGMTGSTPDTLGFIKYLDGQIAKAPLAQFLELGSTDTGARALGESFVDFFTLALQTLAETLADEATDYVVLDLVNLNWGEDEPAPRIVCADVGTQNQATADALAMLLNAGALSPDPELESYVRKEWSLPQRLTPAAPPPAPGPPVNAKRRMVRAAAGPFRRKLTAVEAAARTDFAAVQAGWESALDRLIAAWRGVTAVQRAELREQIAAAVDAGDIEALGQLTADYSGGAALLEDAMIELAAEAAQQQADEAHDQGVTVDPGPVDTERLGLFAVAVSSIAASALANSAGRDALRRVAPGASGRDVAAAVDEHLDSLSDAFLADQLGGAMSAAQNAGRVATIDNADESPRILAASEILDANTCGPCAAVDGQQFDSLADAEDAYASGGYVGCDGGLRCRGVLVAVWDTAALDEAA
ncbi:MAG: DUF935 domain-containing protein [Chloroflexi bacterium]|nr:DUF935 domain-containing protein [Chloroflexota bacterium]